VSAEYTLRKRTGLKQGEAQKNGVAHNPPDRTDDVITECDRLNQHRINAYADHILSSFDTSVSLEIRKATIHEPVTVHK